MSNMSYCRFQNTLADLEDCYRHINDDFNLAHVWERSARRDLIKLCKMIAEEVTE